MRILNIVTSSVSCGFFRGILGFMNSRGFETAVCSSPGNSLEKVGDESRSRVFEVFMEREIRPLRDLAALWRLYRLMRSYRPAIVNASTPKAGLLGMVAARLARVPIRIYLLRGLRLETAGGVKRCVLRMCERLASGCAQRVVCVSESLRQAYVKNKLVAVEKTLVLGAGSSKGVDASYFHANAKLLEDAGNLRSLLGIPPTAPVVGFVGRLTRDKGIAELAQVFCKVLVEHREAQLLLVGDFEDGDALSEPVTNWLLDHPQVVVSAFVEDPRPYYVIMDVLAFASKREGLPNVPLEAAAMEVPVVGFRTTGVVDAVDDGITGTLVPLGDVDAFAEAVTRYLWDRGLRRSRGQAGRERVLRLFRREYVWQAWYDFYVGLLRERRMIVPEPLAPREAPALSTEAAEAR